MARHQHIERNIQVVVGARITQESVGEKIKKKYCFDLTLRPIAGFMGLFNCSNKETESDFERAKGMNQREAVTTAEW